MNIFDIIVIGIIVACALLGFLRGFVKEFFALTFLALSLFLGVRLAPTFAPSLSIVIEQPLLQWAVAFAGIVITTLLVGGIITAILNRCLIFGVMGGPNRLLGFAFGSLKGGLLCLLLVWGLKALDVPMQDPIFKESHMLPKIQQWETWVQERWDLSAPAGLSKELPALPGMEKKLGLTLTPKEGAAKEVPAKVAPVTKPATTEPAKKATK